MCRQFGRLPLARAVPKAAPKPAPKKSLNVPYGAYTNIRLVVTHFGRCLAIGQHGVGDFNFCPWSRLEGAGQCPWWAGLHLRTSRLDPSNLIAPTKDHGSDLAQREQAEAMVTGVMPRGRAGPFATARSGPVTLTRRSGVQPRGGLFVICIERCPTVDSGVLDRRERRRSRCGAPLETAFQ